METIKLWNALESAGTGRAEDDFEPYLELYLQESPETARGAVLVCPGGGYCNRAPHEAGPIAERFRATGRQPAPSKRYEVPRCRGAKH